MTPRGMKTPVNEATQQTANMSLEALVKEHNALVSLVTENLQLREYIRRLEAVVEEQSSNGEQETEPLRGIREEVQAGETRREETSTVAE